MPAQKTKTLYALLVAINEYHPKSRVTSLYGCRNDINALKKYVEDTYGSEYNLKIKTLFDKQATYDNIVDHFGKKHLLKAKENDIVLFSYSGHGAKEKAAKEFLEFFPDGWNETMVCYDSRAPKGKDLADKELAVLFHRLSEKCPHVVAIMDCCHSGSGTKNVSDILLGDARITYDRQKPRPYKSYLNGYYAKTYPKGKGIEIPQGKHLLMAACAPKEKAFELRTRRGLFNYSLLKVLESQGNNISYADLYTKCRIAMRAVSEDQHPQFETVGRFNAYQQFLAPGKKTKEKKFLINFEKGGWWVNAGAVHGLPTDASKGSSFDLYEGKKLKGQATVKMVGVQRSEVKLSFKANEDDQFDAVLTSLLAAPFPIQIQTVKGAAKRVKKIKSNANPLYFEFISTKKVAKYVLKVVKDNIEILNRETGVTLRTIKGDDEDRIIEDLTRFLDHLTQWEKALALQNPKTKLEKGAFDIVLTEASSGKKIEHSSNSITLQTSKTKSGWKPVPIGVKLRNNIDKSLHCALFYMSSEYGVFNIEQKKIPRGKTATFIAHDTFNIPKTEKQSTDIFKVIVSTEAIDNFLLEMEELKLGKTVTLRKQRGKGAVGHIERALGSRLKDEDNPKSDWFTKTMVVTTKGQESAVSKTKSVGLANNMIKIHPHSSFNAKLGLSSATTSTKSVNGMNILPQLINQSEGDMLNFGDGGRSVFGASNVLEITDIADDKVLRKEPLQIDIEAGLKANEFLLPLTFDGEHVLPVGEVSKQANGSVNISIDRVPEDTITKRSLFKALRLCFMKVALKKETNLQKLCWVDYSGETANRIEAGTVTKVQESKNILMVIHGIIGDTQGMADCVRQAYVDGDFDLVLGFDYENLNNPIEKTAEKLKEHLEDAGLTKGSGKKLTILAHSMGGLVSRYYIEKLGGNQVVSHLVMAGTPNAGSELGKIAGYRNTAMSLITFGVNTFVNVPYIGKLMKVLNGSKHVLVTLDQMDYNSSTKFIKNIAKHPDPKVQYSIVAGHLDLFLKDNPDAKKLMNKIMKLGAKLFYGKESNDIAVSTNSIKSIAKTRLPKPKTKDVACHHMNYFITPESMNAIYTYLKK